MRNKIYIVGGGVVLLFIVGVFFLRGKIVLPLLTSRQSTPTVTPQIVSPTDFNADRGTITAETKNYLTVTTPKGSKNYSLSPDNVYSCMPGTVKGSNGEDIDLSKSYISLADVQTITDTTVLFTQEKIIPASEVLQRVGPNTKVLMVPRPNKESKNKYIFLDCL